MYDSYLKREKIGKRKGIVTSITIPANTPICEFKGNIVHYENLNSLDNPNDALQIGPDIYKGPSGNLIDYIRHSCNPNCMVDTVGNRAILYSMYLIKAGSKITFDYSSTSTEGLDTWSMNCNCGSFNCRKIISGFYELNNNIQKEYKEKGIAALFIRVPIFSKKF